MTATAEPADVEKEIARIDRLLTAAGDFLESPSVQERVNGLLDERFVLQQRNPREGT